MKKPRILHLTVSSRARPGEIGIQVPTPGGRIRISPGAEVGRCPFCEGPLQLFPLDPGAVWHRLTSVGKQLDRPGPPVFEATGVELGQGLRFAGCNACCTTFSLDGHVEDPPNLHT